mgnify:CR=1 FL=1
MRCVHEYIDCSYEQRNPCVAGRRTLWKGGGGNSTSSNATTTSNTDKRQVVDGSSIGVSSDMSTVNVSVTDGDAVKTSIDLTRDVAAGALDGYRALLAATVALGSKTDSMQQTNSDLAATLAKSPPKEQETNSALKYGLLAVGGLMAFSLFGKA